MIAAAATITARHDGAAWAYLADVRPDVAAGPICDRSLSAFRAASQRLHSIGWRFEDVVRTWLYLGNITGEEGQTCRYLELNRARTDFYRNLKFAAGLVRARVEQRRLSRQYGHRHRGR